MTPAARRTVAGYILTAVCFAAAYGQAPLYYSNQNQYFLHGLARAGAGELRHDWLAQTHDPTPVFSALVAFTAEHLHPWAFHAYEALFLGIYAISMLALFDGLAGEASPRRRLVFAALLALTQSAGARWLSYRLLGNDYPWFLQAGVAGQYVLGSMFQPSVFGVLLVAGIALFVHGRALAAAAAVAFAGVMHVTYLLPAALLTLGFLAELARERRYRVALAAGALGLVIAGPAALHSWLVFGPTTPETFAEAQNILVNTRIPHHTRIDRWLDWIAAAQIAGMALGVALVWRTRLFLALAMPLLLAALLTLLQAATGNHSLALLFPWRVSAVLVPVALAVTLARLLSRSRPAGGTSALDTAGPARQAGPTWVPAIAMLALAATGLWISLGRHAFRMPNEEAPVMEFVRQDLKPGDLYFLPVRVPNLAANPPGSLSSDFKPLPDKKQDPRVIPPDLQRFRLHTGAPIFVDFKSVPFEDVEVIEWRNRLRFAEEVQAMLRDGRTAQAAAMLRERGVTHLVVPAGEPLNDPALHEVHADAAYRVYRLGSPAL